MIRGTAHSDNGIHGRRTLRHHLTQEDHRNEYAQACLTHNIYIGGIARVFSLSQLSVANSPKPLDPASLLIAARAWPHTQPRNVSGSRCDRPRP